jgi:membrane protein implicated in regulation of membrane protease activity
MTTLTRYVLLQVPGWMLVALVLMGAQHWLEISLRVITGLFFLWVVKDLIFYPFVRTAYESRAKTGTEQLIGIQGIAQGQLDPHGYVRIRGELWRAEAEPSHKPILSGSFIRVQAAYGLTLIVTSDKDHESDSVLHNGG